MRTEFISTGMYVPDRVVTNDELAGMMDTSDEWIRSRTGIVERRWVREGQLTADLAAEASRMALERAGMVASDLDAIIFATLSPEYMFPGSGVLLQAKLGVPGRSRPRHPQPVQRVHLRPVGRGRLDRNRPVQARAAGRREVHSAGLDLSTRGRDVAVHLRRRRGRGHPRPDRGRGPRRAVDASARRRAASPKLTVLDAGGARAYPRISARDDRRGPAVSRGWTGTNVFKHASKQMPELVRVALEANGLAARRHQAPRAAPGQPAHQLEMVQKRLGLRDDQVFNNIQRYGNTTAASIPMALHEALDAGRLDKGDMLILTAFGGGLTWASSAIRW